MPGLETTMGQIPGGTTRRTYGTALWDGSRWYAKVGGNRLTARWLDPIQPVQGGNIVVDITDDGRGQSTALVIGSYADQPRPSTGAVLAVGISQIVFAGEDGPTYATDRFIGTYALNDAVYINWDGARPTIIGKIAAVNVTPGAGLQPEPKVKPAGEVTLIATASDAWDGTAWGAWAGGGEKVYTGTRNGTTLTGAWFYGEPRPELAGKTITSARLRLPRRLNIGAAGTVTIHLYAHTSRARPGTDVTRTAGPFDIDVLQDSAGQWVDLPLSFAGALAGGGGISIAGGSYAGFASRLDDPQSGKLILKWST